MYTRTTNRDPYDAPVRRRVPQRYTLPYVLPWTSSRRVVPRHRPNPDKDFLSAPSEASLRSQRSDTTRPSSCTLRDFDPHLDAPWPVTHVTSCLFRTRPCSTPTFVPGQTRTLSHPRWASCYLSVTSRGNLHCVSLDVNSFYRSGQHFSSWVFRRRHLHSRGVRRSLPWAPKTPPVQVSLPVLTPTSVGFPSLGGPGPWVRLPQGVILPCPHPVSRSLTLLPTGGSSSPQTVCLHSCRTRSLFRDLYELIYLTTNYWTGNLRKAPRSFHSKVEIVNIVSESGLR